jgi:hypothetical protein
MWAFNWVLKIKKNYIIFYALKIYELNEKLHQKIATPLIRSSETMEM